MTEAQAKGLAQALMGRQAFDHAPSGDYCRVKWDSTVNEIKEAIMGAYNDGWENGFEAGKGDMRYGE